MIRLLNLLLVNLKGAMGLIVRVLFLNNFPIIFNPNSSPDNFRLIRIINKIERFSNDQHPH